MKKHGSLTDWLNAACTSFKVKTACQGTLLLMQCIQAKTKQTIQQTLCKFSFQMQLFSNIS